MAYISQLFEIFIALSLNGAGSAEWFMNNPGYVPSAGANISLWEIAALVGSLSFPAVGVGVPEAVLWVLLGVMLLGEARLRALSRVWQEVAEENRRKARRLYEEGLGRGDLSVVDELSSEDFRDLRHGVSGGQGMRRVVLALRESFPDLAVSIEEQEAKEDVVRTRLTRIIHARGLR